MMHGLAKTLYGRSEVLIEATCGYGTVGEAHPQICHPQLMLLRVQTCS